MLKIITNDKTLDFAVGEALKEIKGSELLSGEFIAKKSDKGLSVKKNGNSGVIEYCDTRALLRGVATLCELADEDVIDIYEEPNYDILGTMADVSRNAVMTIESVKKLVRLTAIEGYNVMMLYTEDTYEIEGYPYFGHLRGRYTESELREIDDYAYALGIEIVPCIQTLAHLNDFLEWPASAHLRDCDDIMIAGEESVYALVDKMFATMRKCLRSNKINLGLDEAFMLGCGKYLQKFGYTERSKIMKAHLAKVTELCKKYGYEPRMWSDMFFRMTNNGVYRVMGHNVPDYIIDSVPPEPVLVYWEYIQVRRENYNDMFRQHKAFNNKIAFAGGDASWYGVVPLNRLARRSTLAAVKSIEDNSIGEVYVTMWGDDGAACSFFSTLTTLFIYGEACWMTADTCDERAARRLERLTGIDPEAMLSIEDINNVPTRKRYTASSANPSKYMLLCNILTGKFDCHIPDGCDEHYAREAERLYGEIERAGEYGYIFETVADLSNVLALKAEMGKRIRAAYLASDREKVNYIANEEIPELISRINKFRESLRRQWFKENKTFGYDVLDLRIGGLIYQIDTARMMLNEWISGERTVIEELEAPRIPYQDETGKDYDNGILLANRWQYIVGQDVSNMYGY